MPRLSEAISTLKVDGKTFSSPEWWSSKHKVTRKVKQVNHLNELVKKHTPRILGSYKANKLEAQPPADVYTRQMQSLLDDKRFEEFAPWNPIFRKSKIILVDKK